MHYQSIARQKISVKRIGLNIWGKIHDIILITSKGAHKKVNNTIMAYIHVQVNKAEYNHRFSALR